MELVVVMAIGAIITMLGVISISSRYKANRLESTAQELLSALSNARNAALYKNCPVRVIFCADPACSSATNREVTSLTDDSGSYLAVNNAPARYMAVIRMTYYGVGNASRPCYFPNATDPSPNLISGWDFESKPIAIPPEVRVQASMFVNPDQMNEEAWAVASADDSGRTSVQAVNSIWFPSSSASLPALASMEASVPANIPTSNHALPGNRFAVMQLKMDSCNPASDDDCLAYILAMGAGGDAAVITCLKPAGGPGSRVAGTAECY